MFGKGTHKRSRDLEAIVEAIGKSQAVIEFELDGTIIDANENFLGAMGYTLDEIKGKHHSMFVDPAYGQSDEYKQFWASLNDGKFQSAEYKRFGKGGKEIWIQASYNPISDGSGKPYKVIKFATDVTAEKLKAADHAGQVEAISKSQAVIEFDLDGTIIDANENFLGAVGYSLDEIQGKHHSMFVEPAYAQGSEYKQFWASLKAGKFQSGEYKRFGKGGKQIWIQASYNPIRDQNGEPFKVVKFATDVTQDKLKAADVSGQIEAIHKSQAVIEFNLDGTIITANKNFLDTLGYSLDEIVGKHHSMFVEREMRDSNEYGDFWARLNAGQFEAAEYKRVGKGGKEIYIQASYNPIFDLNGKPYKVVKFATDVTQQVIDRMRSEHIRKMMESVAAGSEELNVSVKEISDSMTKSQATTTDTFNLVVSTDDATQRLSTAAESMGGIVEAINNITGQINLLALNATIESARAGEAGRGFAVVANEVKNLAGQAKTATEQIASEIDNMRGISGDVVTSLDGIKRSMQQVLDYVSSTAAAVEEQSAVTSEMSSNMQQAAAEANRIGTAA